MSQQPKATLRLDLGSLVVIAIFVAYLVPYLSLIGRGEMLPYILFSLWIAITVFSDRLFYKTFRVLASRKLEIILLILFFLYALFTYLFISQTPKAFQFLLMPITYIFIIVIDSYYSLKDPAFRLTIFFIVITVLGIQAAVSIPYIFGSSDAVSRMYTSGELQGAELTDVLKHGIGGANLYANLAGIFFLGIGTVGRFKNKYVKAIIAIDLAVILLSVVSSSYSVSLWMLSIGGIVMLFRANWSKVRFFHIFLTILIFIGLYLFYSFFLVNSTVIEPIQRKIQLISEGNIREDGRINLAALSARTFFDHPFLGVGVPNWGTERQVGEHMPWIDFFAHYGFLGFMPFVIFMGVLFKRSYRFYFKSHTIYATSCFIGFLIFFFANFVDSSIFEGSMIVMLIFFYTSTSNLVRKPGLAV